MKRLLFDVIVEVICMLIIIAGFTISFWLICKAFGHTFYFWNGILASCGVYLFENIWNLHAGNNDKS